MTESKHREAFRDFAERAEEELGGSLEKLVLYGSVARGEEDDESDVDVLVVVEDEEQREKVEDLAFDTSVEHGVFMVPLIKTEGEFSEMQDSMFIREVEEKGEAYV